MKTRPHRLPRGLSCIIVGSIYHPPSAHAETMINYLLEQLASIESTYLNCGFMILGDFNNLDISRIKNQFRLKQLIQFHTRGNRTLDLILTNLEQYYQPPVRLSPFGLSDHFTVLIEPKLRTDHQTNKRIRQSRDIRPSRRAAMGAFINDFDWSILNQFQTCEEKLNYFQAVISTGMDILLPVKKSSAVNRERKKCRSKFYESKVKQLKSSHPKQWWKSIKALCGMNPVSSASTLSHLIAPSREPNLQSQSLSDLANTINQTFLSPMEHFQPLCSTTPLPITTCNSESMASALVITESQVFTKLVSIKSSKAPGPDSIPGWLLKENACALDSNYLIF